MADGGAVEPARRVPFFRPSITESAVLNVTSALRSGWLTSGPRVREFEQRFAAYVGRRHAVATSSGTHAILLALEAAGVGRGDLVFVPTLTFTGTADPVRWLGATPVLVDCDSASLGIDPQALERAVSSLSREAGTPRAVVPMHHGGLMCDMECIRSVADLHRLAVTDDCAHAVPAFTRERASGQWRHVGLGAETSCFSFYANKCVTTGEGGMAATDDAHRADRMRRMSLHAIERSPPRRDAGFGAADYLVRETGFKCNMPDTAAALGLGQLDCADRHHGARRTVAERYAAALGSLPHLELPCEPEERRHAWHLYTVRLRAGRWRVDRDRVVRELLSLGIETSVHYKPLHRHPAYATDGATHGRRYPNAESIWPRILSLPVYPGLTHPEQDAVIDALHACVQRFGR